MSALPTHDQVPRLGKIRPVPMDPGYATVRALQDLSARLDELSDRIDIYFGAGRIGNPAPELSEEAPESRPAALRCPQCNKRAFRKSRRMTMGEILAAFLLMRPFRCRYCAYFEFRWVFSNSGTRTT